MTRRELDVDNKKTWDATRLPRYVKPLLILILAVLISVVFITQGTGGMITFIQENPQFSIGISLALYALLDATPAPSQPLTVFLVALYGPLPAIGITTLGHTFGAIVQFYIGGSVGDLADFEAKKAKLPFRLGELPIDSPVFLLLARLIPGYGAKFVNLACGMYKVPMFTYLWTAVVRNLLGAVVVAYGGYGLLNLR